MTEYTCPNCGGGFPGDALTDGRACPWCECGMGESGAVAGEARAGGPRRLDHDEEPALCVGTARALINFWRGMEAEADPNADASSVFGSCADELERCLPGGTDGDDE